MSLAQLNSITLITGNSPDSRNFGTGFVIYQDEKFTYLLTCAHVVKDVGGSGNITVGGLPATVAAIGEEDGFDLAVLQVEGLWDKKPLKLLKLGEKDIKSFVAAGFSLYDKVYLLRSVVGELGKSVNLESRKRNARTKAWDLKIQGENYLQRGYSGSPIIDEISNCVLGVISHKEGSGEKGLAISVDALEMIWQEMPIFLLQGKKSTLLRSLLQGVVEFIHWYYETNKMLDPETNKMLDGK